ncbi:MAG: GNAT family N-acetyltransferase [Planctomycetia bacterium]|nr:GNAT family N-acetyltransferase [Planctomycetia bacterium]
MAGRQILETERLILREFDEDDAEAFFALGSDPEVIRYTADPGGGLKSLEQALEVLRDRPIADYRKHGFGRWACIHKATGLVIGFAGLKYLEELQEVDLGYRFLPDCWGQGFATEASRSVMCFAREHLDRQQVIGLVVPEHTASIRVLEKLGFTFAGFVEYLGDYSAKYVIDITNDTLSGAQGRARHGVSAHSSPPAVNAPSRG